MRKKGNDGELIAKKYLMKHGFNILKTNYYTRYGELDIIAQNGNRIHVVEVKLSNSNTISSGYKINRKKRKRMIYCTYYFMDRFGFQNYYYQFDLITITDNQIKHVENIFSLNDVFQ
ncbi:MAG: YraN family protein [Candidatus Margulisiibacteriota bacterium]